MKESSFKGLIKKSIVNTTPDFTDKVIGRIELGKEKKDTIVWSLKSIFIVIGGLFLGIIYIVLNSPRDSYNLINNQIGIKKLHVLLFIFMFFLFGINYVLKVKKEYITFKNNQL